MANVNNTLYPPIIPTYQPAFLKDTICKIYFSLSSYNSYDEIKSQAQVTVSSQFTNQSVLKPALYPNNIKLCAVQIDSTKTSNKYYIEVAPSDLINGFEINQYYKVQIRFTSINAPAASSTALDKWLIDNVSYFSEWSTICLIRGISSPSLALQSLIEDTEVILTKPDLDLVGTFVFDDSTEEDSLDNYRIRLYDEIGELIQDSGIIYTNPYYGTNEINYTFDYQFSDGDAYSIIIDVETTNHYTKTYNYQFLIIETITNQLTGKVVIEPEEHSGRIKVSIVDTEHKIIMENITIRRSSSRSKFTIWEDVHTESYISDNGLDFVWYDCTIESGVWYTYAAQKRDNKGERGSPIYADAPVIVYFEDMFLNAENQQLRIKYNPKVTSFKHTVAEAKTDTLGSKYPYIRRNGAIEYKQMNIAGLITLFDDYHDVFTSREELLNGKDNTELYDGYNDKNRINEYNDYVWEREFREKVTDFLYKDNVKLFRTLTEGNILVKLMNITLSPEEQLGRYLYSFSADAYEVADFNIKNCDYYDIQSLGEYSQFLSVETEGLGQLQGTFSAGSQNDIINLIQEKYTNSANENMIITLKELKSVRIHFESEPYLIKETSTGLLQPLDKDDSDSLAVAFGYILYLNGVPILVHPDGVYEVADSGVGINSLYFPIATSAEINYVASYTEEEDLTKTSIEAYSYQRVNGQIWGEFAYEDSVFNQIWQKYFIDYDAYYQTLVAINSVRIEANPNTVIYIKTSEDEIEQRYVLNDTCVLSIYDDNIYIKNIYFAGVHLYEAQDESRDLLASYLFVEEKDSYNSLDDIEEPKINHVYTVDNIRYIWYNNQWKVINESNDVETSIDGIVDYCCDVVKGVYDK